jgi:hypothetical protein
VKLLRLWDCSRKPGIGDGEWGKLIWWMGTRRLTAAVWTVVEEVTVRLVITPVDPLLLSTTAHLYFRLA